MYFILQIQTTYANDDVLSRSMIMMLQISASTLLKLTSEALCSFFFFFLQLRPAIMALWCSGEAKSGYDRFEKDKEPYRKISQQSELRGS